MVKNKFICFVLFLGCILSLASCGQESEIPEKPREYEGLVFAERVETEYADKFAIDRYNGGYSMIYTPDTAYLLIPEGKDIPQGIDEDIKIIDKPVNNVYLAATAAMTFFDELGAGNSIRFSGTKAEDWYIDYAREAMRNGDIVYAGKYSEPDYELLVSNGCNLSVQSTMILHTPEVKEKLEELGMTVFVDYSSYESHPLARSEWVKVYGEMTDKAEEADSLLKEQIKYLSGIEKQSTGKTVAYFYINNNGQAVVRKNGDYVTKMIELAGGENVFGEIGANESASLVTMETEKFYELAKDADIIIYNGNISSDVKDIPSLIAKNSLLADFKAVREKNVWISSHNLYQETMKAGEIISDFNAIFSDDTENRPPKYLYKAGGRDE